MSLSRSFASAAMLVGLGGIVACAGIANLEHATDGVETPPETSGDDGPTSVTPTDPAPVSAATPSDAGASDAASEAAAPLDCTAKKDNDEDCNDSAECCSNACNRAGTCVNACTPLGSAALCLIGGDDCCIGAYCQPTLPSRCVPCIEQGNKTFDGSKSCCSGNLGDNGRCE